jgi:hypothetical protein
MKGLSFGKRFPFVVRIEIAPHSSGGIVESFGSISQLARWKTNKNKAYNPIIRHPMSAPF